MRLDHCQRRDPPRGPEASPLRTMGRLLPIHGAPRRLAPMPHPLRIAERERADRKAANQTLLDYFARHEPELLAKLRTESLEAAAGPGPARPADQVTADAWRHLISRLRFLDPRKRGGRGMSDELDRAIARLTKAQDKQDTLANSSRADRELSAACQDRDTLLADVVRLGLLHLRAMRDIDPDGVPDFGDKTENEEAAS